MDNSPPNNADHERFPWPLADEAVLTALERIYRDGSWGKYHGPNCQELIAALREYHGVPHVWLTCSGTLAVELALRGVGVASGDQVVLAA